MDQQTAVAFSSTEALRFGWAKTMANLKPLLLVGAVGAILALLNGSLNGPGELAGLRALLSVVVQVLQFAVSLVYVRFALKLHDGRSLEVAKAGDLLEDFFSFLLASILYGLVVAAGLVLLIVPGIIWALKFGYSTFLVVDRKLDPIEAMRQSSRLTQGHKGQLLGFAVLLFGVNLLGAIALGIGLLVTIPTSYLAAAYVLRRLQARAPARVEPVAHGEPISAPH